MTDTESVANLIRIQADRLEIRDQAELGRFTSWMGFTLRLLGSETSAEAITNPHGYCAEQVAEYTVNQMTQFRAEGDAYRKRLEVAERHASIGGMKAATIVMACALGVVALVLLWWRVW